ncbi:alpha/beta hydrolase [uncultured Sphingomonas sp.]|uniref:alpha/beta hydrolase n=1 Tax=uncultured Sphingomonas sp. TaxID=158754 RepID=UPI00262CFF11|nr:alpha/beta hydrolase [uncultured Sphingomonas sp.]
MSRHLIDPELAAGRQEPLSGDLTAETLPAYRAMLIAIVAAIPKPTSEAMRAVGVDDRRVPGPDGAPDVRVLIYTPGNRGAAALPAILHIHGGGFVSGSADMSDPNSRAYAAEMDCVVVSVDYRLAPETPFPGPVEDCHAALLWLQGAAPELGVDPARIVVAGESAGAGLVAGMVLLARDRGTAMPAFQYLAEPMLDDRSVDSDHPHVGQVGWTRAHNRFGWASMLSDRKGAVSPYASPARADDLSGLPPTYIHVGAIDLFLEESLDYARRLTRAGVPVELHVWPGAFHAFGTIDAHVTREARRVSRTALRRALHGAAA